MFNEAITNDPTVFAIPVFIALIIFHSLLSAKTERWNVKTSYQNIIENAQSGEVYVLLVTNYSNSAGIIQIEQTNTGEEGSGSTIAEIDF